MRINIMRMLISVSRSDGELPLKELEFLHTSAHQLGIDKAMMRSILEKTDNYYVFPPDEKSRMTALFFLLFLSIQDGKITPGEEEKLFEYGFRLGFSESLVRDMVSSISHNNSGNPQSQLTDVIRKYLN